ncbi:MAG TPA: GNAT family N-acetyltransferase [Actinomycetota bacterium]
MAEHVTLRDVTDEDLDVFYQHQLDPEAAGMAAATPRGRGAFMAHWRRILADPTVVTKAVLVDGELAGNVVSFLREEKREVGYWIGKRYWGRGVATTALAWFLELIDERPLHAYVATHNLASVRVLEKCGFEVVGEDPAFTTIAGEPVAGLILRLG